jgi:hypothetical protein
MVRIVAGIIDSCCNGSPSCGHACLADGFRQHAGTLQTFFYNNLED